jgi:hypothetical protein
MYSRIRPSFYQINRSQIDQMGLQRSPLGIDNQRDDFLSYANFLRSLDINLPSLPRIRMVLLLSQYQLMQTDFIQFSANRPH